MLISIREESIEPFEAKNVCPSEQTDKNRPQQSNTNLLRVTERIRVRSDSLRRI